jgi:hypothetical protein
MAELLAVWAFTQQRQRRVTAASVKENKPSNGL